MNIADLLGITYPIIQGGMANIATGEFAAAVSEAGALGLIAAGAMSTEMLRENIQIARKRTNKPFGVNLMLMHPQLEEQVKVVNEEKVSVITTGAGSPEKYIAAWKEMGSKVIPVVPSVALAKRMQRAGADAVVAEGTESGGHVGELATMALVPQVVDSIDIPVIAAGGIASGRQMLASFILGAQGVQIGTCLLVSEECPIHENYKNALLKANDTATTVTGRSAGVPVRILKNKMSREYIKREREGADKMELEQFTLGGLRRSVFDGDTDTGSVMAGQVCGMLKEIRPVATILETMYQECIELANNLKL